MNCNEARPLVDASVDRELSAGDEWRLREHLAGCADCRGAADLVHVLGQAVRTARYHRAPAALGAKIAAALGPVGREVGDGFDAVSGFTTGEERAAATAGGDATNEEPAAVASSGATTSEVRTAAASGAASEESARTRDAAGEESVTGIPVDAARTTPHSPTRRGWRWWWRDLLRPSLGEGGSASGGGSPVAARPLAAIPTGWMAAALLVLAALSAAVALNLNLRGSADNGAFVEELVASHVRAQLSGRDLDVPSSDRHTVKPWFNGRIDYAPPVEDLAADGFPLVGGRLDYVGRERVAVLVYRYRLHVIDVYVFPSSARAASGASAPPASAGFALARWERSGMTWWVVTDAGSDVLAAFRTALDARLRGG